MMTSTTLSPSDDNSNHKNSNRNSDNRDSAVLTNVALATLTLSGLHTLYCLATRTLEYWCRRSHLSGSSISRNNSISSCHADIAAAYDAVDAAFAAADASATTATTTMTPSSSSSTSASPTISIAKIVFLGTGSAVPSPGRRNTSSMAILLSTGSTILIDCCEGTQHQLMMARSLKPGRIDTVLITHLHGDHSFGLPGALCTIATNGRTQPLTIVGPRGIKRMVQTALYMQGGFAFNAYPLRFVELDGVLPFASDGSSATLTHPVLAASVVTDAVVDGGRGHFRLCDGTGAHTGMMLHATRMEHVATLHTYGFALVEPTRPGPLDAQLALSRGVRGPQLGLLKRGQDVTLADGVTVVRAAECVGAPVVGRRVCVLQDTYDASAALPMCRNADVVIHECTYHNDQQEKAVQHGHSTDTMAGRFARAAGAGMLVLTHFSTRYNMRPSSSSTFADDDDNGDDDVVVVSGRASEQEVFVETHMVPAAAAECPGCVVVPAEDFLCVQSVAAKASGFVKKKRVKSKKQQKRDVKSGAGAEDVVAAVSTAAAAADVVDTASSSSSVDAVAQIPCSFAVGGGGGGGGSSHDPSATCKYDLVDRKYTIYREHVHDGEGCRHGNGV